MGRRARNKGIANKALRTAQALRVQQDEEARTIADRVYAVAAERAPSPIPLAVRAPVQSAGEVAGAATCRRLGIPVTEENVSLVASYLLTVFVTAYVQLTPEILEGWRSGVAAAVDEQRGGEVEHVRAEGGGAPEGDAPREGAGASQAGAEVEDASAG